MARRNRTRRGSKGSCEIIDLKAVREYIEQSSEESSVYIGCDSTRSKKKDGSWVASYALAVVVHRNSKHGCKVFGDIIVEVDHGDLFTRMMREVELAIGLYEELWDAVGDRTFELHIDVNPDERHGSNCAMSAAVGWVRGQLGIDPVVKPDAFAASYAADCAANRRIIIRKAS